MEVAVGRLLQLGVLLAATVVVVGAILLLAHHGLDVADFRRFSGEPDALKSVGGILRTAFAGDSRSIVQLGLVLLIATPVARVAITLISFIHQRDRFYIGVTTLVLALLLYSLLLGTR
jgi:uncharacterized membrane protein